MPPDSWSGINRNGVEVIRVNLCEHALSPWLDDADDVVLVEIAGIIETLPARELGGGKFKICCIPFSAYDIERGDEVVCDNRGHFISVSKKSGDCGFRFRTDRDGDTIEKIVKVVEEYGCTIEFDPSGRLIAVNAPEGIDQEMVSGVLATFEDSDYLTYETVRS